MTTKRVRDESRVSLCSCATKQVVNIGFALDLHCRKQCRHISRGPTLLCDIIGLEWRCQREDIGAWQGLKPRGRKDLGAFLGPFQEVDLLHKGTDLFFNQKTTER
jgi:hypothetical protein